MHLNFLEFEQPIAEIHAKIKELRLVDSDSELDINEEINRLKAKEKELTQSIFASLKPWQVVQIARHPMRPYTSDYIERIFTDFDELHGDRHFADDQSIIGGIARLDGEAVMVIGHQKGRNTQDKISRNFGMPKPEGYRKALRLMKLAEKFKLPLITLIDTPGAFPGIDAEARGQAEAIAFNLKEMAGLQIPVICLVIGEGGSGGALAIGVGDVLMMLQNSVYSVISPEGCAAILWKSAEKAPDAAEAMRMTSQDALTFNLIDSIIEEPLGGAHRDWDQMAETIKTNLQTQLSKLKTYSTEALLEKRFDKLMAYGMTTDVKK